MVAVAAGSCASPHARSRCVPLRCVVARRSLPRRSGPRLAALATANGQKSPAIAAPSRPGSSPLTGRASVAYYRQLYDVERQAAENADQEVNRPAAGGSSEPVHRQGTGFQLLPRRWVAERTSAWLKRCRRLSVDREKTIVSSVAMVRLAMLRLMLERLCPSQPQPVFNYRVAS